MSPSALLDTGAPIQYPAGQISHSPSSYFPFVNSYHQSLQPREHTSLPTAMNPSNPNYLGFNSRSVSRSSGKGLSRPRLVKLRRQSNNPQHFKSTEETGSGPGPGFNPFRPVSGEFVFGVGVSDPGVGKGGVAEGMKNLRIGSGKGSLNGSDKGGFFVFGGDHSKTSNIDDNMKKLNINDEKGKDGKLKPEFGFVNGDNVGISFLKNVESVLPNELKKKLNIEEIGDAHGSSGFLNADAFGSSENAKGSDTFAKSSDDSLFNRIKNLNLESVHTDYLDNKTSEKESFAYGSREDTSGYVGGERENILSSEMGQKLNIGSAMGQSSGQTDMRFSSSQFFTKDIQTENKGDKKLHDFGGALPTGFIFKEEMQGKDASGSQVPVDEPKVNVQPGMAAGPSSTSTFSPVDLAHGTAFGLPPTGRPDKTGAFSFTSKKDGVELPFMEFKTPNPKGNLFNQKMEFSAKFKDSKLKKKKGKLKQPNKVHLWPGQDFSRESGSEEFPEASESYSPMDISPYQETLSDTQFSRETSVASEESFSFDNQYTSTDSIPTVLNDAIDQDLVAATQSMDINGEDEKPREFKVEGSEYCFDKGTAAENLPDESISGAETESFKSANEDIDSVSDIMVSSAENEASSSTCIERQDSEIMAQFCSTASSEDLGGLGFTFAASSAAQLSAKRSHKKKNWAKVGHDSFNSCPNPKVSYASSSLLFTPFSGASLPLSSAQGKKVGTSTLLHMFGDKSEAVRGREVKQEADLVSDASVASQAACEKWRLRGNQAYAIGDLSKAEDCYTQGIDCVSKSEKSKSCLRALMLCFSNRAATRMALGRMRDALADCKMAAAIDPNFLRVQVRAANCYLALGEVEDASQYYKKCLRLGGDVCVDKKIAVEASDGLQKVQKVSECLQLSSELLQKRTSNGAESALEVITEALFISSYSEKLLEMKAESLFMLRKYEEVIQLCEHTFDSAKKNSCAFHTEYQLVNLDGSELAKDNCSKIWRCHLIFKSNFYLGKLEEAIGSLEKLEGLDSVTKRNGSTAQESLMPLAATVRELLHHKGAGNEAFQAGKHLEAIEHYTAALSRNVESRPFAAICFCNRAAAYKALGQITDAIADCSLAIALDGNYLKAISRRATLYEMIRDYGQAANDLHRLVVILTKQVEGKINEFGPSDRSTNLANDLRQARLHLSTIEEEARKEIPLDMYLILGIEPSASASEIKKAYRKAALRHHPDKAGQSLARSDNGDDGLWKEIGEEVYKDADRLFKMIGEAYAVLSDPTKRSQYDLEEEIGNAQKNRGGSNTYKMQTNSQNYPFESSTMRHWREDVWRSNRRS